MEENKEEEKKEKEINIIFDQTNSKDSLAFIRPKCDSGSINSMHELLIPPMIKRRSTIKRTNTWGCKKCTFDVDIDHFVKSSFGDF